MSIGEEDTEEIGEPIIENFLLTLRLFNLQIEEILYHLWSLYT